MTVPLSVTTEDYLKTIHELTEYKGYASLINISQILGSSRQSAYDEISILLERDYVYRHARGKYKLTSTGKLQANAFLRKHRVAEILLWKGLEMRWSDLDDQAMGIEHGMTEEIIEKVCKKYQCDHCPHGNPIPDRNGFVKHENEYLFASMRTGEDYKFGRVIFETPSVLKYLEGIELLPGISLKKVDENSVEFKSKRIVLPSEVIKSVRFLKN